MLTSISIQILTTRYNNSETTDFKQTIPFWNLVFTSFLLKNKAGEQKLSVNNILNKSFTVTQSATNYPQQQVTNNSDLYFMMRFTYSLNKQLNPMVGVKRSGGGMRMVM